MTKRYRYILILLILLLVGAASAEEDFCGSTPPPHILKKWKELGKVGHSCCTDQECRCTSMICGGPNTSLEKQDVLVVELGERLPLPSFVVVGVSISNELSYEEPQPAQHQSPEPPEPPPPQGK